MVVELTMLIIARIFVGTAAVNELYNIDARKKRKRSFSVIKQPPTPLILAVFSLFSTKYIILAEVFPFPLHTT